MSNEIAKYDSTANKAKGALQRVGAVEQALARSLVSIERRFGENNNRANHLGKVIEAIVEAIGPEQIQEIVTRRSEEEAKAMEARDLAALQSGIENGFVTPTDIVTEMSLIVGNESDGSGVPVGTGRQQIAFRGVDPQFQAQLLGKGVGTKLETPSNGLFEVVEIYHVDEEKGRIILQAKAARDAAEQAQAEAVADEEKDSQVSTAEDSE